MKNPHFVSFLKVGYSCRCILPFWCIILLFCIHVNRFLSIQIVIPLYSLHVIILTKKLFIHFNLNIVCGVFFYFFLSFSVFFFLSILMCVSVDVIEHQHIWAFFFFFDKSRFLIWEIQDTFKVFQVIFGLYAKYERARKYVPVPFIFC